MEKGTSLIPEAKVNIFKDHVWSDQTSQVYGERMVLHFVSTQDKKQSESITCLNKCIFVVPVVLQIKLTTS